MDSDLCSHMGPHTWKGPVLDLTLCCHQVENIDNLYTGDYTFSFFCGPFKWWWPPLYWGRWGYNLAWFYNWKRENLGAECSVKYFLWFLRNRFLFSIQSCPWARQLGIHLLLYWISDVHFLLTLDVFTTANRVLHTCPQLLPWPRHLFPYPSSCFQSHPEPWLTSAPPNPRCNTLTT